MCFINPSKPFKIILKFLKYEKKGDNSIYDYLLSMYKSTLGDSALTFD